MSPREFLRPDGKLILLFIIMAALSVVSLASGYRLVPCRLTSATEPGQVADSTCSLAMLMGGMVGPRVALTPLSYLVLFLLLAAVPYLIACLVRAVALRGA